MSERPFGLLSLEQVVPYCDLVRQENEKIVFTNGCFDILHVGHIRYLQHAKELGDILFVGLNSDSSVRALKGIHRPMQSEQDRAEILLALKAVDCACIFTEDTPLELIKKVRPDFLVKGGDWKPEQIVGRELVESYGGKVLSIPFVDGHSTTQILEKMKK